MLPRTTGGEMGQEQEQRRTLGGQGSLELVPTPPRLGMVSAGAWRGTDTCCLHGSWQSPSRVSDGHLRKLG